MKNMELSTVLGERLLFAIIMTCFSRRFDNEMQKPFYRVSFIRVPK